MGHTRYPNLNPRHRPRQLSRTNIPQSLGQTSHHLGRLCRLAMQRDRVGQRLGGHVRVLESDVVHLGTGGVLFFEGEDVFVVGGEDGEVVDGRKLGGSETGRHDGVIVQGEGTKTGLCDLRVANHGDTGSAPC